MRAVIQRVTRAEVVVNAETVGQIGLGLLVYLGVGQGDTVEDAGFMADKMAQLRIFADEAGRMNRSVQDVDGAVLLISQFTLQGDCRKGRRPGFDQAAEPEWAMKLYEATIEKVRGHGVEVATGMFGAQMRVSSCNDGPVTFLLDSRKLF